MNDLLCQKPTAMDLKEAIIKILPYLHDSKDAELISLLHSKISENIPKPFYNQSIDEISQNDMSVIVKSLDRIVYSLMMNDRKYEKLRDINRRMYYACAGCPQAVRDVYRGDIPDENNNTCVSCVRKQDLLYKEEMRIENWYKRIPKKLFTDDVIMCKHLIFSMNRKLKSIIQNETSQHEVTVSPID